MLSSTAGSSWMPSSASRSAMVVLIFSSVLLLEAVEVVPSVPVALDSSRCGSLPPGFGVAGNRVLWTGDAATAGLALDAAACMRGRWCVTAPNALHGNIWAGWLAPAPTSPGSDPPLLLQWTADPSARAGSRQLQEEHTCRMWDRRDHGGLARPRSVAWSSCRVVWPHMREV